MRLEDSKTEVLERIGRVLGYKVTEQELSPMAKQSVTSIAETLRQLVMMRQLLMVEQANHDRLGSRLARKVTRSKDTELAGHLQQVETLQSSLNERIEQAAKLIGQEMEAGWSSLGVGRRAVEHTVIEQLKCRTCGANLGPPVSSISRCDYCGMEYAISDYLELLGASIQGGPRQTGTT